MPEGLAAVFAGSRPNLARESLDHVRAAIAPYLDEATYPQPFGILYGDEAAVSVGHPPLGLPRRAGSQVALADALARGRDPEGILAAIGAPRPA